MLDSLWNIITFIPWLIIKVVSFIWSAGTSIIGFVFGICVWPFKFVFGIVMSVLLFFSPGTATATNPPVQQLQSPSYSYVEPTKIVKVLAQLDGLQSGGIYEVKCPDKVGRMVSTYEDGVTKNYGNNPPWEENQIASEACDGHRSFNFRIDGEQYRLNLKYL